MGRRTVGISGVPAYVARKMALIQAKHVAKGGLRRYLTIGASEMELLVLSNAKKAVPSHIEGLLGAGRGIAGRGGAAEAVAEGRGAGAATGGGGR
jgi:hypothetical protein